MNPFEKADAKTPLFVERLIVPAVQTGNTNPMNNAAITLMCPSCRGVFLTLQQSGSNLETCPHCAVAAPRVQFQPVQSSPQAGARTVLPARRVISTPEPAVLQSQHPNLPQAPSPPAHNPFAAPPLQPTTGPGWPPAPQTASYPQIEEKPLFNPSSLFSPQGSTMVQPQLPEPLNTLFPPAAVPGSPAPGGSEAPSPFATQPVSAPATHWPFDQPQAQQPATATEPPQVHPFAAGSPLSIPAPVPSATQATSAAHFPTSAEPPLFTPSSALFPPAQSKAELPSLFKTVTQPGAADSSTSGFIFGTGNGAANTAEKPLFTPAEASTATAASTANTESPFANFVKPVGENPAPGFDAAPTAKSPFFTAAETSAAPAPTPEATLPPGTFPSPFYRPTPGATQPTGNSQPISTSPASAASPMSTPIPAPPNNGLPVWPGLGMNHPSLHSAESKNGTAETATTWGGKNNPGFEAKRPATTGRPGIQTKYQANSKPSFARKFSYLIILSALLGAGIWFFQGQPKNVEVIAPVITISPSKAESPSPTPAPSIPDAPKMEQPVKPAAPEVKPALPAPESTLPPPLPPAPPESSVPEETRKAVPMTPEPAGASSNEATPPTVKLPPSEEVIPDVRRVLNALFNPNTTTPDRMLWITNPEKSYDSVEAFFNREVMFNDTSIKPTNHTVMVLPEKEPVYIFRMTTSMAPDGALVRLQNRFGQPPALDWMLFEQSHEKTFEKYSAASTMDQAAEPVWFKLICKRTHEFELPAGTREKYLSLEAQNTVLPDGIKNIHVNLDSAAGRYLDKQMEWEKVYLIEVLVGRMKISGNNRLVVLDCEMSN